MEKIVLTGLKTQQQIYRAVTLPVPRWEQASCLITMQSAGRAERHLRVGAKEQK